MTELKSVNTIPKDIYNDILKPINSRRNYSKHQNTINVPIFFYRVIGIEHNTPEEYYDEMYNIEKKIKQLCEYVRFDKRLDTSLQSDFLNRANNVWNEIKADTNLRAEYLGANLYGAGILKHTGNPEKDMLLKESFISCVGHFINMQKENKSPTIFKNYCIKIAWWYNKYAFDMYKSDWLGTYNPKILFYGDIKKDEIYFLILLSKLCFDIIYFNSESDCDFEKVDLTNSIMKFEFEVKTKLKPFPSSEISVSYETVAYRAEKNVERTIMIENSYIAKPWQYADYTVKVLSMKTSYKEIYQLWGTEANKREGFRVVDKNVIVPNIFAKINGVHENMYEYWNEVLLLTACEKEHILFIDKIPFSKPSIKQMDYRIFINHDGTCNREKFLSSREYGFSFLRNSIQMNMLDRLDELMTGKYIKLKNDTPSKIKILSTVLNINIEFVKLVQSFDYSSNVPKIILYDNTEAVLSIEDCVTLVLLHKIGIDIVLITPSGYNNIEKYIPEEIYDSHNLKNIKFNLELSKNFKKDLNKKSLKKKETIIDKIKKLL